MKALTNFGVGSRFPGEVRSFSKTAMEMDAEFIKRLGNNPRARKMAWLAERNAPRKKVREGVVQPVGTPAGNPSLVALLSGELDMFPEWSGTGYVGPRPRLPLKRPGGSKTRFMRIHRDWASKPLHPLQSYYLKRYGKVAERREPKLPTLGYTTIHGVTSSQGLVAHVPSELRTKYRGTKELWVLEGGPRRNGTRAIEKQLGSQRSATRVSERGVAVWSAIKTHKARKRKRYTRNRGPISSMRIANLPRIEELRLRSRGRMEEFKAKGLLEGSHNPPLDLYPMHSRPALDHEDDLERRIPVCEPKLRFRYREWRYEAPFGSHRPPAPEKGEGSLRAPGMKWESARGFTEGPTRKVVQVGDSSFMMSPPRPTPLRGDGPTAPYLPITGLRLASEVIMDPLHYMGPAVPAPVSGVPRDPVVVVGDKVERLGVAVMAHTGVARVDIAGGEVTFPHPVFGFEETGELAVSGGSLGAMENPYWGDRELSPGEYLGDDPRDWVVGDFSESGRGYGEYPQKEYIASPPEWDYLM